MFEDRKQQFLTEKREKVVLSDNLENFFDLAKDREEELGRDICEWNSDEIIGFYKYYSTPSISVLNVLHSALNEYANWCLVNGLIADNQNHFSEINTEALCKCVDNKRIMDSIYTRQDILDYIKDISNYCGQFIILGLFEGIPVTDNVMKNVKLSDLNGNKLSLSNGKELVISSDLIHIMHLADQEDAWYMLSDKPRYKEVKRPYVQDGCIVRYSKLDRGKSSSAILIGSRFRASVKYSGLPGNPTMKNIMESGRICYILNLMKEYGCSWNDCLDKKEMREKHEYIYGKIQSIKIYKNLYGGYFDEMSKNLDI